MAEVIVAQRMWQRRDTAANWTSVDPVLAAGEIGVEMGATSSDPQKFKIGNGVTAWSALAYFAGGGGGGGSTWYTGSGVPSSGLGDDGDFYLRDNGDFYQKASGAWVLSGSLMGPAGADGADGAPGPAGGPTEVLATSGSFTVDAATHKGKCLLQSGAGVITFGPTAAAGFAVNDIFEIRRQDSGAVSFATTGGAVLDFNAVLYGPEILNPKDIIGVKVIAADTYMLVGPLVDA